MRALLGPTGRVGDIFFFGFETAVQLVRPNHGSNSPVGTTQVEGETEITGCRKGKLENYLGKFNGIDCSLEVHCCIVSDLISHSRLIFRQTSLRARIGREVRDNHQSGMRY